MREYVTEHFARDEVACKCGCGFNSISRDLMDGLEVLRSVVDRPIRINSGCRCYLHNAIVGGAYDSQHLHGRAADVVIEGVPPIAVGWIARALGCFSGIKVYGGWTHLDVRDGKRFYDGF